MSRLFILFFFSFLTHGAYTQTPKFFSADKELSSSMVNNLFQDHYGMIWIATEDGTSRYDGSKFITYKKNRGESGTILHNFSRLIFQDDHNNLFIGFVSGLQSYDYATDTFKEIPLILENGNPFDAHVTSIIQRRNGEILIGTTGRGIFRLQKDHDNMLAHQNVGIVPSLFVHKLYEDKSQNLWIITQDMGLFRLNPTGTIKHYPVGNKTAGITISSICEDRTGNIYVGSSKGFYEYQPIADQFYEIPYLRNSNLSINALKLANNGEILIGSEGNGLKVFDPLKKNFTTYNYSAINYDISDSKVNAVLEDQGDNLWLSIFQKGVMLIPANRNNFQYIGYKSNKNNSIGSHAITAVFKDRDGHLWVGTDGDGLYQLDPDGRQKKHIFSGKNFHDFPATVLDIYEDSDFNLWIGSYDHGLVKMNGKTGHFQNMNYLFKSGTIQAPHIFDITEDEHKTLWVGTMGSGIYSINLMTDSVQHFMSLRGVDNHPQNNVLHTSWINCLLITSDEKLFIGTVEGIGCLDLKTRNFVTSLGANQLLSDQIVYTLYEDKDKTIWIGTSEGLMYLEPNSDEIKSITTKEGLSGNVICAITEDYHDNLWVSTNHGIFKLNLFSKELVNYYADDGLQGNEFNKRVVFRDKNEQIIFGGINGITLFYPNQIKDEGEELLVSFTGFYIHDKPVKKGTKSGSYEVINLPVMNANTFHLAHNDNSFTIEFSAMEFSNPDRITYMYQLDEGAWITLRPGTNTVTFSNLLTGTYVFKVRAKNYQTYSEEKAISIIIHPVWYFSNWAKTIYIFIFGLILAFVVQQIRQRQRTRIKMQEHEQAKQINDAKLQFFINIAHEIRTPLSLIISPLKKIIDRDHDQERQTSYVMMNRNAQRILHLVNQLMDIQKIDKGQMALKFEETEIVGYIRSLCGVFDAQLDKKQIDLNFQPDIKHLYVWIDPGNFDKVILNVLSNAIKFTPKNGQITVDISPGVYENTNNGKGDYVQIVISDSGIGIPHGELDKVFDYFYQVKDGKHKSFDGTGIGLHLSRSIVELHHGSIMAENNSTSIGCRFIIRLPLGHKHLKETEIQPDPVLNKISKRKFTIPALLNSNEELYVKSRSKNKILVVDDDKDILAYISGELALGYHVSQCSNGKEALSFTLKNTPDLIISDVMMSEMDGITLCRKIKQNTNINHIPVILLTAKSNEEDNLEGLGIGADAYITKPFNIEILKKTVQNIIRNRQMLRNSYSGSQEQKDKVKDITMKSPDEKLLSKVIDIVNQNIGNHALNVEMLAREIGISRVHLHRKLKALTNQSTRDFIRNIRLHQAANLLSEKYMNISEVAFAVGFNNVAHFSNAFKEFYGESPKSYMEAYRKAQENA